jgi:hypothetical protein
MGTLCSKGVVTAAFVISILLGMARAEDKPLKKSELPAPVQKTADEQSTGALVRGYSSEMEGGKLEYEVQMTINKHSRDVSIAPDGRVLEIEEEVSMNDLPASVRDALKKKANSGTITKIESLTKGNKLVAYEAQLRNGAKRSEIQVGPQGEPLARPE